MVIKKRSIAVCILLSIVTCGIYGIYWFYTIAQTMYNHNTPNRMNMSPGLLILLWILTGGFFGVYIGYKWGKQMPELIGGVEDRSVLYLILAIFELHIINFCLVQNDLNQIANA